MRHGGRVVPLPMKADYSTTALIEKIRNCPSQTKRRMKLAIFLPNWLGDLVMATPALRAMRRHFGPHAQIVGILRPNLAGLLAGTNWLDEQWLFDPHGQDRRWRRWALVRRMRRERFDMALLLTNSLHTALLAWLGGARQRVGYVRYGAGRC